MKSKNITATEGRLKTVLKNVTNDAVEDKVNQKIKNATNKTYIYTGVITKFYPYIDKAEVKLDRIHKKVICKILHRYGGDMIDFYTPYSDGQTYCDKLKEPCVIPKATQNVVVLKVRDEDSEEMLILGYYQNEAIVGFNPAKSGNIKITSITEPNLYWIKFGRDGLNLRLPNKSCIERGLLPNEMEDVDYLNKNEMYSRGELLQVIDGLLTLLNIDDEDKELFFNTYFNVTDGSLSLNELTDEDGVIVAKDKTVNTVLKLNKYECLLDGTVTVYVTLTDGRGNPLSDTDITLSCDRGYFEKVNGGIKRTITLTTNANGVASTTYNASEQGLVTFNCNNMKIQCNVFNPTSRKSTKITLVSNEDNVATFTLTNFTQRQVDNLIISTTDTDITVTLSDSTLTINNMTKGKFTLPYDYNGTDYYSGASYTFPTT